MKAHAELPETAPEHFQRWLALFHATAREICAEAAASLIVDRLEPRSGPHSLDDYLRATGRGPGQCLFPGRRGPDAI